MTLQAFRESRVWSDDLGQAPLDDALLVGVKGWLYDNAFYIQDRGPHAPPLRRYACPIMHDVFEGDELEPIEALLYDFAVGEGYISTGGNDAV